MKIKKANAAFGLLTILLLLAHAGYQVVAYIMFIYDPLVTKVLAWACTACVLVHAVLGMSILMFSHDGSALMEYPRKNMRTILQRASAIGILVTIILHIQAISILHSGSFGLVIAEVIQFLTFSFVFTHIATSFSNAFITLGLLENMDTKKRIDTVCYIICGIFWLVCVAVVGTAFIAMASMPQGG